MRTLEILLLVVLFLGTGAVLFRLRPSRSQALVVGSIAVLIFFLHTLVEGLRWQMVPALILLAILLGVLGIRALRKSDNAADTRRRGVARRIISGTVRCVLLPLLLLFVSFLPAVFPVFELPAPSTQQQVGVRDIMLRFDDRPELLTKDPNDQRELLLRVWYPAKVAEGAQPKPYFTPEEARAVTEALRMSAPVPLYLNDHATLVRTHSYRDAELAPSEQRYPVLVFSHGYGSYVSQNTALMQELASVGYVVFSIAHTYDGSVVFPDGRSPGQGEHLKNWMKSYMTSIEQTMREFEELAKNRDQKARRALLGKIQHQTNETLEKRIGPGLSWAVWLEDQTRFFDVLEELNSGTRPSIFAQRLDLNRIGLMGMSFGGATAAEVCHAHAGCRAAINLDGGQFMGIDSALYDAEISKPLLMIYASDRTTFPTPNSKNPGDFQAFNDFYYESEGTRGLRNDVVRIRIDGTTHIHLSDASLMTRYIAGGTSGISGTRVSEILNRYCRAFLDHYVKGTGGRSPLLNGPVSEFPEVTYQTFGHGFEERRPPTKTTVSANL